MGEVFTMRMILSEICWMLVKDDEDDEIEAPGARTDRR